EPGVHARGAAEPGLGIRLLRGRAHRRRPRPPGAGEARPGARRAPEDGAERRVSMGGAMSIGEAAAVSRRARYEGFQQTIKAVGTGERGRRSLDFDEARAAMAELLAGSV